MRDSQPPPGPQPGHLLIADPGMTENLFSHTLVYLHTCSEEGAMGFILNRPLGQTLERMADKEEVPDALRTLPLFFGGPVQSDHLLLAHFIPDTNSHRFRCELNPDPECFRENPHSHVRAFMGVAGWSAGQLQEEIARNDWSWISSDEAFLQEAPGVDTWRLAASGDQRWQQLRTRFPKNFSLN